MSCWTLIPFKGFEHGKSRLSGVLDSSQRAQLARELFDHVVRVLRDCPSVDGVAVISDSSEARDHARALGITTLQDPPDSHGLSHVVDSAVQELEQLGATSVLICMSDLPELSVQDIESVIRQLDESDVVLVPDLLHEGTNLVALQPPTAMPSCFGHADSLDRHRARASELGLTVSIQLRSGIGFDVDDPGDLERLRRR
jgi:2-phospho-L-lactate guanylyltransferase